MAAISAWDTFFMMLTVIPVSKMMSSIFMKLVARVGTVDEERLALGGMASMMAIGATASRVIGGKGKATASGIAKQYGSGSSGGGDGLGAAASGAVAGGGVGGPTGGYGSQAANDFMGVGNTQAGAELGVGGASPSGGDYGGRDYHDLSGSEGGAERYRSSDAGGNGGNSGPIDALPKRVEPQLDNIMVQSGETGNKWAKGSAMLGAISPVAGPAVAAALGVTAKMTAGAASTVKNVGHQLYKGTKAAQQQGDGFGKALGKSAMNLTGTGNPIEATTRILGTVLGSPLGSSASKWTSNTAGNTVQWVNKKMNNTPRN